MIIEQLDSVRLLITLQAEDLHIFDLTPEQITMDRAESVMLIRQILSLALNHANISAENAADMIDEKIRELKKTVLHDTENCTPDTTIQEHKHYYGGNDNEY